MLYKYRTWSDRTADVLKNQALWFSTMGLLNDPMEGRFRIDYSESKKGAIKEYCRVHGVSIEEATYVIGRAESAGELDLDSGFAALKKLFHEQFFVLSLSKRWDNNALWALYSDGHQGICIGMEMDINSSPFLDPIMQWFGGAFRHSMHYSDDLPVLKYDGGFTPDDTYKVLTSKTTEFQFEEEVRYFSHKSDIKGGFSARLLPGVMREVIVGCRANPTVIDAVKALVGPGVRVYRSRSGDMGARLARDGA